ncbi:stage III sporulation protein AF [Ammoniphilus resinae]|uniref:Stage III sporulation protein AF n=1 Tax=Ammoniphilus resinae TaxID=861532 RepID=A0ABS4GV84_9BACL|nr:stage III sporulation protein AF [Ammoniphilus resinae]MBP1934178.1 stage III sporulation protein AF [Ammoniphilus resinae]
MIHAISGWLQGIILLILLASLLDLILPNSGVQRYVKFVMGLLILLAIITPIMQIFKTDLSPEKLALKILQMNSGNTQEGLHQVSANASKLASENDKDVQVFVQEQLASLIKEKVQEDFGITVSSIKLSLQKDLQIEQEYPEISSVQLILDKDMLDPKNGGEENSGSIDPIEPVTIQVSGESSQSASTNSSDSELSLEQRKLLNEIAEYVASTWNIDRRQVIAKVEGTNREG